MARAHDAMIKKYKFVLTNQKMFLTWGVSPHHTKCALSYPKVVLTWSLTKLHLNLGKLLCNPTNEHHS
jgi:hypothetical protein